MLIKGEELNDGGGVPPTLVSIIVPVYNTELYVRQALSSLLEQSHRQIEVLAIDDGSTDGSKKIMAELAASDSRLRVVSTSNRGQAAARNLGLEMARGEYVAFVDSDDFLDRTAVAVSLMEINSRKVDAVFYEAAVVSAENSFTAIRDSTYSRSPNLINTVTTFGAHFNESLRSRALVVSCCLFLIRAAIIKPIRFPVGFIHEDVVFYCRVMLTNAERLCLCLENRFYNRRVRSNSTMTSPKTPRHVDGYLEVVRVLEEELRSTVKDPQTLLYLDEMVRGMVYELMISAAEAYRAIPMRVRKAAISRLAALKHRRSRIKDYLFAVVPYSFAISAAYLRWRTP